MRGQTVCGGRNLILYPLISLSRKGFDSIQLAVPKICLCGNKCPTQILTTAPIFASFFRHWRRLQKLPPKGKPNRFRLTPRNKKPGSYPLDNFPLLCVYIRHPYVGIIQIRLSVEGRTFLSACNTSSRLFQFKGIIHLQNKNCKRLFIFLNPHIPFTGLFASQSRSVYLRPLQRYGCPFHKTRSSYRSLWLSHSSPTRRARRISFSAPLQYPQPAP